MSGFGVSLDSSKALKIMADSSVVKATSRRDFFKKTAIYSAGALSAASVLSPVSLRADDKRL